MTMKPTRTPRRRHRLVTLSLAALIALGVAGCDTGDEAGIGEAEFTELEDRVTTLEEDFGAFEEDFNGLAGDGAIAENGGIDENGALADEEEEEETVG